MKKKLSFIVTMIFMLTALFSINTYAATSGGANTKTIHVETKANWLKPGSESITLKQNKAKYTYKTYRLGKGWVTKSGSIYPTYKITIKNNTKGKSKSVTWKDGSEKLNLDRNCTYTITVAYDNNSTWLRSNCNLGSYTTSPYWYVSKTNKVSTYY